MSRLSAYLDAVEAGLKAAPSLGLRDVKPQLDAVDLEDIGRQSFVTPAARIVLVSAASSRNPDRSLDLDCTIVIAVLARAEPGLTADQAAVELGVNVLCRVDGQRWGLQDIRFPQDVAMRPALQAAETKGITVVVVAFRQTLLRVLPGIPAARGLVDPDGFPLPVEQVHLPDAIADMVGSEP